MPNENILPKWNLAPAEIGRVIGNPTRNLSGIITWALTGGLPIRAGANGVRIAFKVIEVGGSHLEGNLIPGADPFWNIYSKNCPGEWYIRGIDTNIPAENQTMFGNVMDFRLKRNPLGDRNVGGVIFGKDSYIIDLGGFREYNHEARAPFFTAYVSKNGWGARFNPNDWFPDDVTGGNSKYCVCINNKAVALKADGGQYIAGGSHTLTSGTYDFEFRLGTYVGVAESPDPHVFLAAFGYRSETIIIEVEDGKKVYPNFRVVFNDGSVVYRSIVLDRVRSRFYETTGEFQLYFSVSSYLPYPEMWGSLHYSATLKDGEKISGLCSPSDATINRHVDGYIGGSIGDIYKENPIKSLDITLQCVNRPRPNLDGEDAQ